MTVKGMEILNIYEDSAQQLGMKFYPNISKTIYYANPYQNNVYICLDEYFDYIKKELTYWLVREMWMTECSKSMSDHSSPISSPLRI